MPDLDPRKHLAGFLHAYGVVMKEIPPPPGHWEQEELEWFRYWVAESTAQCESWTRTPHLAEYLTITGHTRPRAAAVAGYAYLHLAYDLPRFLANSLDAFPEMSRPRGRALFKSAAVLFVDRLMERCTYSDLFGALGTMARWTHFGKSISYVGCNWMIAHRCSAWVLAESIAGMPDRDARDRELWGKIESCALPILRHENPFRWLSRFPLPESYVARS